MALQDADQFTYFNKFSDAFCGNNRNESDVDVPTQKPISWPLYRLWLQSLEGCNHPYPLNVHHYN